MAATQEFKILIVDDEDSIRESLGEFLRDYDMTAITASSAEEGIYLLQKEEFDLIIVDIRLPGINGDQFIAAAHQLNSDLKFIIHTGSVHFRVTPELASLGLTVNNVFLKPVFELNLLLDKVRQLLSAEEKNE